MKEDDDESNRDEAIEFVVVGHAAVNATNTTIPFLVVVDVNIL